MLSGTHFLMWLYINVKKVIFSSYFLDVVYENMTGECYAKLPFCEWCTAKHMSPFVL